MNVMMRSVRPGLILGGAAFGGLYRPVTDDHVQAALAAAWDGGIRSFDTAPHYGVGLSEERMGSFLSTKPRSEFILSTKVGRLLVEDSAAPDGTDQFFGTPRRRRIRDYSADGVLASVEASLGRLGLDRIDVLLVHDPDDYLEAALTGACVALRRLRDEGVVAQIGVGVNDCEVARTFVARADIDVVMIAGRYSLLDREAEQSLLGECADQQVAVQVAGVFNSGLLADPGARPTFNYEPAPPDLVLCALLMQQACERWGVSLRAAALQFPARHRVVTSVVSGAGSVSSVIDTLRQLNTEIPGDLWAELDRLAAGVTQDPGAAHDHGSRSGPGGDR